MADLITHLCQIAATELREAPQATTQQLADRLKLAVEQNQALQAALQSDDRLIQINQGDVTAFQTLVSGGIANIGVHLQGADEAKLIEIVREVLRSFQPVGIPQNLPSNGTATFVGRDTDMAALHDQLQQSERVVIASIHGMGGIGKTELALQYALRHVAGKLYSGGVCWLRSREEIGTQIVSFARSQLGLQPPEDLELLEQVRWCWRNWQAGEVLAVFDDVQQYADVEAFLPPAGEPRFKVLMTTRLLKVAKLVQNFEIKVLDEASALNLLKAIVPDGRIDQDLETARQLCEWLGYLPLGLELVGQYLEHDEDIELSSEDEDCPGLWQRLQKARLDAIALKETYSGMTATDGVAAAFELSWQQLDEAEQRLAALLSLFALAEIPWIHVQSCLPNLTVEELERLRNRKLLGLHLLQRTGKGMYQLHQLIREFFAAKRLQKKDTDELKTSFCRAMVITAERIPYSLTLSVVEEMTSAIPHIVEVATNLEPWLADSDVIEPFRRIGWFYKGQGAYGKALAWLEKCSEIVERRLGNNHSDLAYALNSLATVHEAQGHFSKAESLYLKSLEIWRQQSAVDPGEMAACMNNLAGLYSTQGQYVKAERLYIQSLNLDRQYYADTDPEIAKDLANLAELHRLQGRYAEAEDLLTKSLRIQQLQPTQDPILLAMTFNNFSLLSHQQGRIQVAEEFKLKSIDIERKHLQIEHPQFAGSLNNLAELYRSQGRNAEAEPLFIEALEILQKYLGNNHINLAMILNNLSLLYLDQERYQEAELCKLRSLEIEEAQLGSEYPQRTTSLSNLALIYQEQKRYVEAEQTYKQAIVFGQQQLGIDHLDVALSLSNLATLYVELGRYVEAEPLFLYVLQIYDIKLGEEHPKTQAIWQDFGVFLLYLIENNRTSELSGNPMTRSLLQKLQTEVDARI